MKLLPPDKLRLGSIIRCTTIASPRSNIHDPSDGKQIMGKLECSFCKSGAIQPELFLKILHGMKYDCGDPFTFFMDFRRAAQNVRFIEEKILDDTVKMTFKIAVKEKVNR